MKVSPQKALDVGVGFGRWGIIIREFCDVWNSRVLQEDWSTQVEGIEAFEPLISEYHKSFYNNIHIGDARKILPDLCQSRWDIIIFGDVLEHFEKNEGQGLLNLSLDSSEYVMVNIPIGENWPQDVSYKNPYEKHLSVWDFNDFQGTYLCRYSIFTDYIDRPFCSVILSKNDPKCLSDSLFSRNTENTIRSSNLNQYIHNIETEIAGLNDQISILKQNYDTEIEKENELHIQVQELEKEHQAKILALENDLIIMRKEKKELDILHNAQILKLRNDLNGLENSKYNLESQLQQLRGYVMEIESSKAWKLIKWIWHLPIYIFTRNFVISLFHKDYISRSNVKIPLSEMKKSSKLNNNTQMEKKPFLATHQFPSKLLFSEQEQKWLETIHEKQPETIAVLHPDWRGIHTATEGLFHSLLEITDTLDPISALHYADLFAETKCSRIVFSGFPITYRYLVLALKKRMPRVHLYVIYHGTFNKFREDYDWRAQSTIIDLAKGGKLDKIGFVKAGMAEVVNTTLGLSTGFVMNFVEQIPNQASSPLPGGPHLGMWLLWSGNWQKPPFAMMAASAMIPGSILHGSDADERMMNFVKVFQIRSDFFGKPLPQNELLQQMSMMHLNLYVTFHECAPMLPLESLSVGVPCLIGPVSHYFEDHAYLHKRLVVPYPDRAEVIASQAIKVIEERDEIIQAYRTYAPVYNQLAKETLNRFLETD